MLHIKKVRPRSILQGPITSMSATHNLTTAGAKSYSLVCFLQRVVHFEVLLYILARTVECFDSQLNTQAITFKAEHFKRNVNVNLEIMLRVSCFGAASARK